MPSKNKASSAAASKNPEYDAIASQWAKAKAAKEAADAEAKAQGFSTAEERAAAQKQHRDRVNKNRKQGYERRWWWTVAFWGWLLVAHAVSIWLFTSGFLLTRLVLEDKASCDAPPADSSLAALTVDAGCWHPKKFDRAVIILIDALRYDFTVPADPDSTHAFHNAFPFLYETAAKEPQNAFLRPFIADPPTTTLQRLKGLTTGTLPTFIDAGSNFAGTAIDEDNLLMQLRQNGKKIAHLGDDTWHALFPGYFEANISKAYESFRVWDLHTVDNGVIDNIFPLLDHKRSNEWDLLIGHCLGVDHAGHRYGPEHPAMTAKLQQMDEFVRKVAASIDDTTVLIVMGDHGMDGKGDHGGESDDEVEAALWMYSKKPAFGRTKPEFSIPPANAKIRPVGQIDFVPTLALLLGIPIPFNNLGKPIEEAFAGVKGNDWASLAAVSKMAAAGIDRYQDLYFKVRGIAESPAQQARSAFVAALGGSAGQQAYEAFNKFQDDVLDICKGLWARFDVPRMIKGVVVTALGVVVLMLYASRTADDEYVVTNNAELDYAEQKLEMLGEKDSDAQHPEANTHRDLVRWAWDPRVLLVAIGTISIALYRQQPLDSAATVILSIMMASAATTLHKAGKTLANLLPTTFWGWLGVFFTVSQSVGFASNSYTIWEDSILLFFITTFAVCMGIASLRIESRVDRTMAIYHSVAFALLGRLASFSKLCREEQMPFCTSTYYASATSSTSATWQLAIPLLVFATLPSVIKSFLTPTKSYDGLAPAWIGAIFRSGVLLAALYWVIDAADNGGWFANALPAGTVKTVSVYVAQIVLAIAFVAGTTAFIWAPPSVSIVSSKGPSGQPQIAIMGYANALGGRYIFLPLNVLLACLVLTKPMGFGALALMMWQILSLVELLDLNGLKTETIGPIMLAVLGNFYFFKTGHQAVLASIQWDAAFIPLVGIRYPWSPIVLTLNTCAGPIIAAASVPLLTMWKVGPKQKGVLEACVRSAAVFVAFYAVEALATMAWAGHLRRHLMLYRIFNPRFMVAAVMLIIVDLSVILFTLTGIRSNTLAVAEVFEWAD
ncbi:Putative Phosphoethanolamine transferase class O [[Torrubiella] hemipterigena]|uniref:Putative Phosphoethanolamine transferase class O n=1 Tax=[Torrubiella] hemipterigena TaxID=1531966 RepID=A0A0A1SZG2_9HYPO|nr:Putative Phosphoethanolamine transferase class O [[Torrubiella] hemipterigena]